MNTLYLDAQFTKSQIAKLRSDYPELDDDLDLMSSTLEGETNAYSVIQRALEQRQEAEMMAGAIKAREIDLAARRARFERKSEAMKSLIKSIMKVSQLPKLTLPDASLTITKPRPSVGIEDLDELPQGFFRLKREADKLAIHAALFSGQQVPGAILVLGAEGLTIRTK